MPMLAYSAGLLRAEDEQLGDAFEGNACENLPSAAAERPLASLCDTANCYPACWCLLLQNIPMRC
jgi:hypothetical protein